MSEKHRSLHTNNMRTNNPQSMTEENRKMQPWQVFHAARKALGANIVARIFNREVRSAHNWAQDPVYTQARCKSPLELLHTLFERLDEVGRGYVAQAGLDYLSTALSGSTEQPDAIKQLLPTMDAEKLADYTAVAAFQKAIDDGADADLVETLMREAEAEIERTYAKWLEGER